MTALAGPLCVEAGSFSGPAQSFSIRTGKTGQTVYVSGDFNSWDPERTRLIEERPGYYTRTVPRPWGSSIAYKFVVDGVWIADPSNGLTESDGWGGVNSVIEYPDYREDPALAKPPVSHEWRRETWTFQDPTDLDQRELTVVAPPPRSEGERLGAPIQERVFVYFQDGGDYLDQAAAANVLSNLSRERGMPEFVGVFVPPRERMDEYSIKSTRSERYVEFLARRVVPAIESRYGTPVRDPRRLLVGPSLGGLVSIFASIRYPEVFPRVASQSGAFWFSESEIRSELEKMERPSPGIRWSFDAGFFETENLKAANQRLRAQAAAKGIRTSFVEFPTAHRWIGWRGRLPATLRSFFGQRASGCSSLFY